MLFPGQRQDFKSIEVLWQNWPWDSIKAVVGDKGYASSSIREEIKQHGAIPIIPSKGAWCPAEVKPAYDPNFEELYAKRNFIERFFGRIKDNKRIAMRFDKLDITFLSFIALASLKAFKLLC